MTDNDYTALVARLRAESAPGDVVENRTNALMAADLIETLLLERDKLTAHIARRIVRDAGHRAEDDFGDASIGRAMAVAREQGTVPTENKSRLVAEAQVREAASEIWDDEGVELWLDHPNNMLSQMTPRQAVAAGNGFRVLAIIDGLADGVVW